MYFRLEQDESLFLLESGEAHMLLEGKFGWDTGAAEGEAWGEGSSVVKEWTAAAAKTPGFSEAEARPASWTPGAALGEGWTEGDEL